MTLTAYSGPWERVNNRANKTFQRGRRRRRRKDQCSANSLRRVNIKKVRYTFRISPDNGPLSFLFEEAQRIAEHSLMSRTKIIKVRRRQARHFLRQADSLTVIRTRDAGAIIVIPAQQRDEDFWVPVRRADCQMLDAWHWMIGYEPWQQQVMLELLDTYDNLRRGQLVRLFEQGEVRYESPRVGTILIEIADKSFRTEVLQKIPAPLEPEPDEDDGLELMHQTWEDLGSVIAA